MGLYVLILAVMAQIFSPNVEFAITARTLNNKANTEIETQPLKAEIKIRKCSKQFKTLDTCLCFSLINLFCFLFCKR